MTLTELPQLSKLTVPPLVAGWLLDELPVVPFKQSSKLGTAAVDFTLTRYVGPLDAKLSESAPAWTTTTG